MPDGRLARPLCCLGAVLAAAGIALAAYAAHAGDPLAQTRLQPAALFAFGNGIALAALGMGIRGRLAACGLMLVAIGTLLFSGALLAAHVLSIRAAVAPTGGLAMIAGWLLYAVAAARRR